MEPKGSLPHFQVPTTCPYPEQHITHTETQWDGYFWNVKR